MARAIRVLSAVQEIYNATVGRDRWTRALAKVASAVRSEHSFLLVEDAVSGAVEFAAGFGLSAEELARFVRAIGACERPVWKTKLRHLRVGTVSPASELEPDFASSAFYGEAIQPMGGFFGMPVMPLRTPRRHVYLAVGRRLGRDDYGPEDVAVMRTLVPHLATALRLSHRLAAAQLQTAGANAALEVLSVGIIVVDAAGKIIFANSGAEAAFTLGGGLRFADGGLVTDDPEATRALHRLIAALADGGTGGSIQLRRGNTRSPLHVFVAPLRCNALRSDLAQLATAHPAGILVVSDPERERPLRSDQLRDRFGLTRAEADVALEIVRGDGRQATAQRLGITLATVRTHLQHVFEKTGVRRQTELGNL